MADLPESDEPAKVTLPPRDESTKDIASLIAAAPDSPVALQGMEKIRDAWKKGEKHLDEKFEQDLRFERDQEKANSLLSQYTRANKIFQSKMIDLVAGRTPYEIYDSLIDLKKEDENLHRKIIFTLRDSFEELDFDMPPQMRLAYDFDYYFEVAERREKDGPYTPADIPKLEEAFFAAVDVIFKLKREALKKANGEERTIMGIEHDYPAAACLFRDYFLYHMVQGDSFKEASSEVLGKYIKDGSWGRHKYTALCEGLSVFCEKLGLPVPEDVKDYHQAKRSAPADIVNAYRRDFSGEFAKYPDSPLKAIGPVRLNAAYEKMLGRIEALYAENAKDVKDEKILQAIRHEHRSLALSLARFNVRDLIKGESAEAVVESMCKSYEANCPRKWAVVQKIMPEFLQELGLAVPAALSRPPATYMLIVDDSLEMDLKERSIECGVKELFNNPGRTVVTWHAKDLERAHSIIRWSKLEGYPIDTLICDYKLHRPGEEELYGDKVIPELLAELPDRPKNVFLISKSGFSKEDQQKLAGTGITYAHSHELAAIGAYRMGDASNLELSTEMCTTSNLREWANREFGLNVPTGKFVSPNIEEKEKGKVHITEVMERLATAKTSTLGAYQLLDPASIGSAFRARVDGSGVREEDKAPLPPGIKGPSFKGRLALSKDGVIKLVGDGKKEPILLVLAEDYSTKHNATVQHIDGLVLLKKGTQHIAVMARNKGIPVAFARGVSSAVMSVKDGVLYINDRGLGPIPFAKEGDEVTFDGESLTLYKGSVPLLPPDPKAKAAVRKLAEEAPKHIGIKWHPKTPTEPDFTGVRVGINIDSAKDLRTAFDTGLKFTGIGLVRSERGLLEDNASQNLQDALLGEEATRMGALNLFKAQQQEYFSAIFEGVHNRFGRDHQDACPVTVRLLDPAPSEYIPNPDNAEEKESIAECAKRLHISEEEAAQRARTLYTENKRGAAFILAHPEIYKAQLDSIFKAAYDHEVRPKILIPNVTNAQEMETIKAMVEEAAAAHLMRNNYQLGAMLESKNVVLTSDYDDKAKDNLSAIVKECDFVSYGTNDLTESMLGLPRGDLLALAQWQSDKQKPFDPFFQLDDSVKQAIERTNKFIQSQKKSIIPINLCGDQALSHKDAAFFLDNHFSSVSVAPTEESICTGLINSGGAALKAYTKLREEKEALAKVKPPVTALPEGTHTPYPKVLARSPVAFVCVEDDAAEAFGLAENLEGKPIVISPNISSALENIAALKAQGKRVVVITDMQVEFGDDAKRTEQTKTHGWLSRVGHDQKWGVELSNAIRCGDIKDVDPKDVALVTAGNPHYYNLHEDVKVINKSGDLYESLLGVIEDYEEQSRAKKRGQGQVSDGQAAPLP